MPFDVEALKSWSAVVTDAWARGADGWLAVHISGGRVLPYWPHFRGMYVLGDTLHGARPEMRLVEMSGVGPQYGCKHPRLSSASPT